MAPQASTGPAIGRRRRRHPLPNPSPSKEVEGLKSRPVEDPRQPKDELRKNDHQRQADRLAELRELTEREREICARIAPSLKQRGFLFVGIDVIGDVMTEINVTSPTGIREVARFDGADIAALLWDAIEARR